MWVSCFGTELIYCVVSVIASTGNSMNFFLAKQYDYIVLKEVNEVRSRLESITRTPWYDITVNLSGKVSDDNTFKLFTKLSFGIQVFNVSGKTAILTGLLEPHGEQQTIIHTELRPNYALLTVLYFILIIFFFKLITSFNSGSMQGWIEIALLAFMLLALRSVIHFSMGRLKNRFEKFMLIHPVE